MLRGGGLMNQPLLLLRLFDGYEKAEAQEEALNSYFSQTFRKLQGGGRA